MTGAFRAGRRAALAFLPFLFALARPLSAAGGLVNVLFISSYEAGTAETAEVIGAFRSEMAAAGQIGRAHV